MDYAAMPITMTVATRTLAKRHHSEEEEKEMKNTAQNSN